ncbi:MAG TPA: hypothetical protein DEP50_07950 [Acinetobacter lwoffii]|nr:hypothetical protein [Acinetobacter lwoffii]
MKIIPAYKVGLYIIAEMLLRLIIHPRLKASFFRVLGASIGKGVRIHEAKFIHPLEGFKNLILDDYAYIGPQSIIDLSGEVCIGKRSSISPGSIILTHADPGSFYGNMLSRKYPRKIARVTIGDDSWIGAGAIVLCGVTIGAKSIIGAGSLVSKDVANETLYLNERTDVAKNIHFEVQDE